MKGIVIFGSLLAAGAFFAYTVTIQGSAGRGVHPASALSMEGGNHYPLQIKGLSYSSYDSAHHRQVFKIRADEFKVQPRKLWLFNVNPINEATLTNAVLEIHLGDDQTSSSVEFFSLVEDLLPRKKGEDSVKRMGIITRGVVNGLVLKVYDRENKLLIEMNSEKGEIDFSEKEITFENVRISKNADGEFVASRRAVWDRQEKVLKIPGEYLLVKVDQIKRGRNLRMGLDFFISSM